MGVLSGLEPKKVFYWFEEITKIPHGSGDMEKISSFCESFAKERNLFCIRDKYNNIIIKKSGTDGYEKSEPVILQGHLDMVCEKKDGLSFDFKKDSLKLKIEDDCVTADGTTLGADNGIAVAYVLAILDSDDIAHPEIEAVFTVDEEIGLIGAGNIDMSSLNSKRLINLDIEDEGVFTVSCAGGAKAECTVSVAREAVNGNVYEIEVSGLLGGHSGVEIAKNRGNSNVIMARLLNRISQKHNIKIAELGGGFKDNVIPNKTTSVIVTNGSIDELIEEYDTTLKNEYKASDKDITISFKKSTGEINAVNEKGTRDIIYLLTALPDGIQKMSSEIEGLPETSLNMGILDLSENKLIVSFGLRSSVESEKEALIEKMKTMTGYAGGTVEISGVYSGWEFNKDSALRKTMVECYKRMYNKEPVIEAIHAGLECGAFCEKIKGLDCISIGPDMWDIHTFSERLSIASTKRVWEFLLEVLKELK